MYIVSARMSGRRVCPLPLGERATPSAMRILMGEGLRSIRRTMTPHPIELAEGSAPPSPSRGEGTPARVVLAARIPGALP